MATPKPFAYHCAVTFNVGELIAVKVAGEPLQVKVAIKLNGVIVTDGHCALILFKKINANKNRIKFLYIFFIRISITKTVPKSSKFLDRKL